MLKVYLSSVIIYFLIFMSEGIIFKKEFNKAQEIINKHFGEEIKKIGKKNCYECKNYQLYDVCSCGDGCRYQCIKNNRIDSVVSMNCNEHYEKCKGSDSK